MPRFCPRARGLPLQSTHARPLSATKRKLRLVDWPRSETAIGQLRYGETFPRPPTRATPPTLPPSRLPIIPTLYTYPFPSRVPLSTQAPPSRRLLFELLSTVNFVGSARYRWHLYPPAVTILRFSFHTHFSFSLRLILHAARSLRYATSRYFFPLPYVCLTSV